MKPALFTITFISGLVALTLHVDAVDRVTLPDLPRMMRDIRILSHPDFAGRQAGSEGGRRSAEYVAERFEQLSLSPAGQEHIGTQQRMPWGQTGPVTVTQFEAPATLEFSFSGEPAPDTIVPQLGSQFLPVLDSPSVNLTAPLVFVGYGIADPARGWDEYEGVAVRDRVVMFLRGKPSHYPLHVHHAEKERIAREKGAAGFITFTGPVLSRYAARRGMGRQPLAFYTNAGDDRPLPGVWIGGEIGTAMFDAQALSVMDIQTSLNEDRMVQSRALNSLVHVQWEAQRQAGSLVNVLAAIPGRDPVLKDDVVILGAHRDHFGNQAGLLFPGADDNASGTAVLLELARILKNDPSPKRTILFASFSGEEQNLLGATWYVRHPTHPLANTVAMINVDHVGSGNGELTVGVTNMSKEVAARAAEQAGLSEAVKLYGFFPGGDHVPFAKAGIPTVAVVTAGPHPHFHQASDTPETIQADRLGTAARFVLALTRHLATAP